MKIIKQILLKKKILILMKAFPNKHNWRLVSYTAHAILVEKFSFIPPSRQTAALAPAAAAVRPNSAALDTAARPVRAMQCIIAAMIMAVILLPDFSPTEHRTVDVNKQIGMWLGIFQHIGRGNRFHIVFVCININLFNNTSSNSNRKFLIL